MDINPLTFSPPSAKNETISPICKNVLEYESTTLIIDQLEFRTQANEFRHETGSNANESLYDHERLLEFQMKLLRIPNDRK